MQYRARPEEDAGVLTRTSHDLQRFVEAQDPVWADVTAELREGRKTTHWIWFVFPQIEGLGRSGVARRYAIGSIEEARAYLAHPVLGARLREGVGLMLLHRGSDPGQILGGVDALKFRSCLTLFAEVARDGALFREALEAFYYGEPDKHTLEALSTMKTQG